MENSRGKVLCSLSESDIDLVSPKRNEERRDRKTKKNIKRNAGYTRESTDL